jgi:hypothetical protein
VGPAGLVTPKEINDLQLSETVGIPDVPLCLSHSIVSPKANKEPDFEPIEHFQAIYARINACTAPDQLDGIMKLLWSEWYPSGVVTDSEAELLTEAVERRRPTSRWALPVGGGVASVGRLASRVQRRFMPRKPQRSPDRKAFARLVEMTTVSLLLEAWQNRVDGRAYVADHRSAARTRDNLRRGGAEV